MHNLEGIRTQYPRRGEYFGQFELRACPRLDLANLNLDLLVGDDRRRLDKTGFGGDASLYLSYKGHGAAIACFEFAEEVLKVIQFKGVHSRKGYRVFSGLRVVSLYAAELASLAENVPGISGIHVPTYTEGISGARDIETAVSRNTSLAVMIERRLQSSRLNLL